MVRDGQDCAARWSLAQKAHGLGRTSACSPYVLQKRLLDTLCTCAAAAVGHPASVDALAEFDADTLLTGSSDGVIRIVSILPNKMLGVVGEHDAYPVERLSLSHDR